MKQAVTASSDRQFMRARAESHREALGVWAVLGVRAMSAVSAVSAAPEEPVARPVRPAKAASRAPIPVTRVRPASKAIQLTPRPRATLPPPATSSAASASSATSAPSSLIRLFVGQACLQGQRIPGMSRALRNRRGKEESQASDHHPDSDGRRARERVRGRAGSRIESTRWRSSERPTTPIAAASLCDPPCALSAARRRKDA